MDILDIIDIDSENQSQKKLESDRFRDRLSNPLKLIDVLHLALFSRFYSLFSTG